MSGLILPGDTNFDAPNPSPAGRAVLPLEAAMHLAEGGRDRIERLARTGFRALELDAGPGRIADPVRLTGGGLRRMLRTCEARAGALAWSGELAARERSRRRRAVASARAAAEAALELDAPLVVLRPWGEEATEGWRYVLDSLHDLAAVAGLDSLSLALEGGGEARDALRDGESLAACLREAPGNTVLGVGETFAPVETVEQTPLLRERLRHARLGARLDEEGALRPGDPGRLRRAARMLLERGGGTISIQPAAWEDVDEEALRALQARLVTETLAAAEGGG